MWETLGIRIGSVNLENRLFLAPMAGITNMVLRLAAKKHGAGLVCTEMICAEGVVRKDEKTLRLMATSPEERPVAIQLFGRNADVIASAAQTVEPNADIIDLNFGCPAKTVVKGGSGSALMKQPELVGEIVSKVAKAVSCPVTAKIRSGWDRNNINAQEVARIIEDSGASAVIVHPRPRSQGFSGHSDWNIIKDVKNTVNIPVIGNGDVNTPEDAKNMVKTTGCDGVMIGRGVMGNTWIFQRTIQYMETGMMPPPPSPEEKLHHLLLFASSLVEFQGEYIACREIRKFIKWYTKEMPQVTKLRRKAVYVESLEELEDLVNNYMNFLKTIEHEVCQTECRT